MALTAHQQIKMQELVYLIESGEKRITLTAKAGCGKTFMMNELIKILKTTLYQYGAIYVTAPTHKALVVLKSKIKKKSYIHFKTIHAAHQLKRNIDFKTGNVSFVQIPESAKNPRFKAAQVVIVDESTMLEAQMIKYNDQHPNLLFIFVGDPPKEKHPGQLPPVNEGASPIFKQNYPNVHLEEIVRQGKGSPIIELSNNLSLIKSKINVINEIGAYVFENDKDYIISKLAEVNGTDEIKYLAWTNAEVDKMNQEVRERIYGNPRKIELGESLIFTAPYKNFKNNEEIKIDQLNLVDTTLIIPTDKTKFSVDISSGNLIIVEQFVNKEIQESYDKYTIKVYQIGCYLKQEADEDDEIEEEGDDNPKSVSQVYVLHEDYISYFNKKSSELKTKCKAGEIIWPAYYWFIEQFAQFTYNHAITVHKSLEIGSYKTYLIAGISLELTQLQSNMKMSA